MTPGSSTVLTRPRGTGAYRIGAYQLLRLTDHSIDGYRPLSLPWLVQPLVATDRAGSGRGNGPGPAGEFPLR